MARTLATATEAERKATAAKARKNSSESTDDTRLFQALQKLGATVGPINDSTRSLYRRRLDKLMKQKGLISLDQILENEEEETIVIQKPKNTRRGRQRKNTAESEEEAQSSLEIKKKDKKAPIEEPKNIRNVRRPATIVEDETEEEEPIPFQNQIEEVTMVNRRNSERKMKDKKVSFARIAIGNMELSDAEERREEKKIPVKLLKKRREPSVDVISVVENNREHQENKVYDKQRINRTIVIEEESEESEDEKSEIRALNDTEEEEGEENDEVKSGMRNEEEVKEYQKSLHSSDDEENGKEDNHEIREEDEANWTASEEEEEEKDIDVIGSEEEMKDGSGMDDDDASQREEGLTPPRRTMNCQILIVTTPTEIERVRRMDVMKEEDELDRRRTIELFNTNSRRSHRSTMHVFRGKGISRDSAGNKAQHILPLPNMNIFKIPEESENMDISNGSEKGTSNDNGLNNLMDDSEDMEISNTPQNGLMINDSEDMNISNTSVSQVDQMIGDGNNRGRALIGETPRSSRSKSEREEGLGRMRNKEKGRNGEASRVMQSWNRKESEENWARSDISPSYIDDPFKRRSHRRYLDDSVGMDTFNNGIEANKTSRIHSTPNLVNTLVDREKEISNAAGKTFIVTTKRRKTPPRLTRNILRSPSRSPTRNRRDTYVIPQSSLFPSTSSMVPFHSPSPSRAPPKPMPRRIIKTTTDSFSSSLVAPPPSITVAPPVPAPRRMVRERKEDEKVQIPLEMSGDKMVEKGEEEKEEVSPASRFLTQPRPRQKKEEEKEMMPIDREKITKLRSLRATMKEMSREGRPIRSVELEARLIVENSPYLKPFFY